MFYSSAALLTENRSSEQYLQPEKNVAQSSYGTFPDDGDTEQVQQGGLVNDKREVSLILDTGHVVTILVFEPGIAKQRKVKACAWLPRGLDKHECSVEVQDWYPASVYLIWQPMMLLLSRIILSQ